MNPNEELDKLKKDLVDISQRVAEIQKEEARLSKLAVCFDRGGCVWSIHGLKGDYHTINELYLRCDDCGVVVGDIIPEGEFVSVHGDEEE